MEYSYHLQQRFPALQITAEVQVAPAPNRMMAQLVGYAQVSGFLVSFFGDQIFAAISMPVPEWARYLQENRGTSIMMFFVGNMVVNSLTQTGAFEIYLGGELVHSKIKSGTVPDINSLVAKIRSMRPDLEMADPPKIHQRPGGGHPRMQRVEQQREQPVHHKQPRHISQDDDDDDEEF
jgi:selT/selW/selH-like putative selenoprotein